MVEQKREPATKEASREQPARKPAQTLRQTPPPIPGSKAAKAGADKLNESRGREIDEGLTRALLRQAVCILKIDPGFNPAELAKTLIKVCECNEAKSNCGAGYRLIETSTGMLRLYDQYNALASLEKCEKCKHVATLEMEGRVYSLYREIRA